MATPRDAGVRAGEYADEQAEVRPGEYADEQAEVRPGLHADTRPGLHADPVDQPSIAALGAASFLAMAEGTSAAIARFDAAARHTYMNGVGLARLGLRIEDVTGRTVRDLGMPEELDRVAIDAVQRVFRGEQRVTTRTAFHQENHGTRWLESTWLPERDERGTIVAAIVISHDITRQVQVEEALEESEVRFHAVFENVPFGMAVSSGSAHGYATNANTMLANMLGYTRDELAQMHFADFTHPDDVGIDSRLLEQVQRGVRDGYAIEKRLIRKDGSIFWSYLKVSAARADDGSIRYVVGLTEDITERKEIESEVRASEERFRALVEHSSDLIAILEKDGRLRYVSPSHRALLGYSDEELRSLNSLDFVHPDDIERVRMRMGEALSSATSVAPDRPIRFRSRDGSWRWLMVTLTNMHDNPSVRGFVVNARDVTRELRLQEQLTQAQKMEALGQLAGGVAHDFNNILAAISGYTELLLMDQPEGSPAAEDLREIARATARGAGVTKQLLAFSRRQTLETEVLDLGLVLRETGRMLRAMLPAQIELELPDETTPPVPVRAARAQIEQIVMNLAVNARDAMPAGGLLRIRLSKRVTATRSDAVLVVSDSGTGMSDEVRARAFEPFFTTKAKGQGTGLGLATVYGLVHQFGGRIDIESAPSVGTRFTIRLPMADGHVPVDAPESVEPAQVPEGVRVLLAEDEPQLRALLARALERAGYGVVTASDGAVALTALHNEHFDLVVSDIAMPRLGGRELAAAIGAGWPEMPVVLMSGYAELGATPEADNTLPANVPVFIEKPFEVERLLQLVAEVLAARD